MKDVALRAGVAPSTVSRALRKPHLLDAETLKRIQRVIRELGFTPNAAARNLRGGAPQMVLIVLPEILSPVVMEVLRAVDSRLATLGYGVIIGNVAQSQTAQRRVLDLASGGLVGGVLVLSGDLPADGERTILDAPVKLVSVLCDHSDAGVPSVISNDEEATFWITEFLIRSGHVRFLHLGGPRGNYHSGKRTAGFRRATEGAGLAAQPVVEIPYSLEAGADAVSQFLQLQDRPTAVVCSSDEQAIGFVSGVRRAGLSVPAEVSVTGFDGIQFAQYAYPSLTTIRQPFGELGETAARLLVESIGGAPVPLRTLIESRICIGESVARR
jgi:LacI family repressor for deo operon, udp, cdd, tsx, nupC, and nupG